MRRSASSGAFDARAAVAAWIEKLRGADGVAGRESVLGEHRQAGRSGVAAVEQQVDHRGMDPAAASRREQVRGELRGPARG